jgi:heme exporter protein A
VSRVYGREFALHRVSLAFPRNTVTALVGENGAGKTTLLNILATLDRPTHGTVRFGDQPFDSFTKTGRSKIGWVSHDALVYEDLTGRENLEFYGRMYGLETPDRLAEKWLERVGLDDVGARRVRAYSRGMRQRLSVARALLHQPPLLLLDEPLTGLDRAGRDLLMKLFASQRDRGCIVVMITHDLHVTRDLVDRVAVLKRGKLAYLGDDDVMEAFAAHG